MKKPVFMLIVFSAFLLCLNYTYSQAVSQEEAQTVGNAYLKHFGNENEFSISACDKIFQHNEISFYLIRLYPEGFIIVSAIRVFPPVLAYSFDGNIGNTEGGNPLLSLINADLSSRLNYYKDNKTATDYSANWNFWLTLDNKETDSTFQQWPGVGDGWLKTNYTQNAPFNNFCPIDPVTTQRSIAGCPAVAMAQILNFHETINDTQFDDGDDYYHNYAGRQYMIDDDYSLHDFPSFPELNAYLDTLNLHYENHITPTNDDKAALTFACGVAATQVYTSSGSGTFSVNQALDAYLRFGFSTAELLDSNDADLYDRLKQNIKDTLPAHLAIVDSAWSTGHNVVVDGYNTDEYYHLNFGWGGSYNAWYLLPQEIPYNLTVVEGVVVDIIPQSTASIQEETEENNILFYPNPAQNEINLEFQNIPLNNSIFQLYDICGRKVKEFNIDISSGTKTISVEGVANGLYLYRLKNDDEVLNEGKIVVARY